jgi:hypothetical protein
MKERGEIKNVLHRLRLVKRRKHTMNKSEDKIVTKKRKEKYPPVIHAKKIPLPDEWIAIDSGSSPVNLCTISHFCES